mmetsp:Transcript_2651/g.4930  ORF Transcript_2651/g.4930 Transcript_2651/m.4930 type:complete len:286 (-) Transcript_2651:412-1269(-)
MDPRHPAVEPRNGPGRRARGRLRHRPTRRPRLLVPPGTPPPGLQIRRPRPLPLRPPHLPNGVRQLGLLGQVHPTGQSRRRGLQRGRIRHRRPELQRILLPSPRPHPMSHPRLSSLPLLPRRRLARPPLQRHRAKGLAALRPRIPHRPNHPQRRRLLGLLAPSRVRGEDGALHLGHPRGGGLGNRHFGQSTAGQRVHLVSKVQSPLIGVCLSLLDGKRRGLVFLLQTIGGHGALVVYQGEDVVLGEAEKGDRGVGRGGIDGGGEGEGHGRQGQRFVGVGRGKDCKQ